MPDEKMPDEVWIYRDRNTGGYHRLYEEATCQQRVTINATRYTRVAPLPAGVREAAERLQHDIYSGESFVRNKDRQHSYIADLRTVLDHFKEPSDAE